MRPSPRLLLADADRDAQHALLQALQARGLQAEALHGIARLQQAEGLPPADLLLLACPRVSAAGAPDALTLLRGLRLFSRLPVIALCEGDDAADRVLALRSGADDCLACPWAMGELLARIEAVLRRGRAAPGAPPLAAPAGAPSAGHLSAGPWRLDPLRRTLCRAQDTELPLTESEFRLMCAFFQRPRHVLLRADLLALAGPGPGPDIRADSSPDNGVDNGLDNGLNTVADPGSRGVDLLVSRLRGKLGDSARSPRWIQTVRGRGYRFNLPQA